MLKLTKEVGNLDNKKKKFNQKEYIINYIKSHKKRFACDLNIDEYEELELLLKNKGLSKVQFLRNAIQELKK